MTPSPVQIGIIGCGHIGRVVHLQSLRRLPNVRIAALADADAAGLEAAGGQCLAAKRFTDYRALIAQPDVEAVIICLPNALHAEAAIAALQRGKHIYLEKPLAATLDDGRSVRQAWQQSGRIGVIGFNYRHNPLHVEMRRRLQAGEIGDLIGARSVWTTAPRRTPDWKAARQTGGGVLLDLASHHFDLMRFWFDQEIVEVSAKIRSVRIEGDTATVQLRLANGMLVESFFSLSSIDDERFEFYGTKGKLSFDRFNSWNVELTDLQTRSIPNRYFRRAMSSLPNTRFALNKLRAPGSEPSYSTALTQFVSAAGTGQQIHPDLDDGLKSLAAVIAAEESACRGVPVVLPSMTE